jgi:hypothetical protein
MAKDLVPIYLPVKYQSPAQKRVGSAFKAGVKFKNQASNIGKKILGAGKKIFKRTAYGIGLAAAATAIGYGMGAKSRRYNKAPKFGESGRDLTNRQIGQMTDYYFDD